MGLTPYLRNLNQNKFSEGQIANIKIANSNTDAFAPDIVPEKKPSIVTNYDDRSWGNMYREDFSNFEADMLNDPSNLCAKLNMSEAQCTKFRADQAALRAKYGQSGSKESFADWYTKWKDTPEGAAATGTVKQAIGSLWDKLFPPTVTPDTNPLPAADQGQTILGMKPLTAGIVAVVTVAALIAAFVIFSKSTPAPTAAVN